MKTVCDYKECTACKACINICPKHAIRIEDRLCFIEAVIDESVCIGCGLCETVCQVIHQPVLKEPVEWYQGWTNSEEDRLLSSSGGFANAISRQFINEGGSVVSCKLKNGRFVYDIAETAKELEAFRGSKYAKSDPEDIYSRVNGLLKKGKKVLFIGLPCHVGGLKRYLDPEGNQNLITVDLVCHGSPSQKLLDAFLKQYGDGMSSISDIRFRDRTSYRVTGVVFDRKNGKKAFSTVPAGVRDRFSIGFLNGLFCTENCYHCQYAGPQRVADITLGDSWGTKLALTQINRGISLALCQSEKGANLLKRSDVTLIEVDLDHAIESNRQLKNAFPIPDEREMFFNLLKKGKSFNKAVSRCYPNKCFRQDVKSILTKLHIIRQK